MARAVFFVSVCVGVLMALPAQGHAQAVDAAVWEPFLKARTQYQWNCSPCHGRLGAAPLTYAPSFALGEGLRQEYGILLLTIQNGGIFMPPWENILSYEDQDWLLFYAHVLPGDNVFRKECSGCHERSVPLVPAAIPRGDALATYEGPIHVTRGTEVKPTWSRQDRDDVVKMLRALAEDR